jgi:nucleoside-diphosphate-sugar epimerase
MSEAKTVFLTGGSGFVGKHLIPALVGRAYRVRALARSNEASRAVAGLGAEPVSCDLADQASLTTALSGAHAVIHGAARFKHGGPYAAYYQDNVVGTNHLLAAAQAAGVARFVHVGAAGCLLGGKPILDADESWPLQELRYSSYFRTKTISDRAVLAANRPGFLTCVVRPGWIWGADDPVADELAEVTRHGRMMFVDGGKYPIVTSHVDNTVSCLLLALERGAGGQAYFVFDEGTILIRDFICRLVATRGVAAPDKRVPYGVAFVVASLMEAFWAVARRPGMPPLTRELIKLNGGPFVVSDAKARRELGYAPVISREEGLHRLATAQPAHVG